MKIAIDAGHNPPADWGAEYNEYIEYILNRRVATEIQGLLYRQKHEVLPFMGTLKNKVESINIWKADIAIEIHHNAHNSIHVKGSEVLYYPNSSKGKQLAESIIQSISWSYLTLGIFEGYFERNPKADILYFLKFTNMPAVIVECLYITNYQDREVIKNDNYKFLMAERIVEGIEKYLGNKNESSSLAS